MAATALLGDSDLKDPVPTSPLAHEWYWENLLAAHTGGMVNLCPYLTFSEAKSLPSRAQFQKPQGRMLGLFQGREKAGLGSGQGHVKGVGSGLSAYSL